MANPAGSAFTEVRGDKLVTWKPKDRVYAMDRDGTIHVVIVSAPVDTQAPAERAPKP